ncbi:MAG: hypothetical protein KDC52_04445, partial [Ignavibacteriae bacterium]|nr:hypothetical protein [Ignavibacteriota bacterium]
MIFISVLLILIFQSCASSKQNTKLNKLNWKAFHLLHFNNDEELEKLGKQIPRLSEMGINKIILEVYYHFNFQSHPELRQTD